MMNPSWYENAVFYEVYVRAFFDSNADGHGDINGLAEKLDYLKELGVDYQMAAVDRAEGGQVEPVLGRFLLSLLPAA